MPDNYARLTGAPRRATLGGETVLVSKLTPRGLGEIQAFFMDCLASPYERAKRDIEGLPDDEARDVWTKCVMDARESWPPELGSDIATALLSTAEGKATLVWVAASEHTDGMTRTRAARLASVATDEEIAYVMARLLPSEVGDLRNPDSQGGDGSYSELRAHLCETHHCLPGDIDRLSFEAIADLVAKGKPTEGMSIQSESQVVDAAQRWREFYVGL